MMLPETPTIRITYGSGSGPTKISSYDAALYDAGICNYNLVSVSSVIPEGSEVELVTEMPDLGPIGGRLWVVQARTTIGIKGERAVSGLAWVTGDNAGIFYESSGGISKNNVLEELIQGIDACKKLRGWNFGETKIKIHSSEPNKTGFSTSIVVGVYGKSESMF
jgi:arginine decarboxylase